MPADHRRGHRRLDEQDVLKLAVDPEANPQAAFLRIEVDVGRLAVAGAFQDLVDQLRQAWRSEPSPEAPCGRRDDAGCGSARAAPRRPPAPVAGSLRITVVGRQRAQSLERKLVEHVGRDQVELEDRLAQVAIVLVAVDLRDPHLLGRQAGPRLIKSVDQGLIARREARKQRVSGDGGSAGPASTAAIDPAGGCGEEGEGSTAETSSAYGPPRALTGGEPRP